MSWNAHKRFHLVLHTETDHLIPQLSPNDFNRNQMNPQAGGGCERSLQCVPRLEKKITVLMGRDPVMEEIIWLDQSSFPSSTPKSARNRTMCQSPGHQQSHESACGKSYSCLSEGNNCPPLSPAVNWTHLAGTQLKKCECPGMFLLPQDLWKTGGEK